MTPTGCRLPLVRRDGELVETTWDEAFAAAADGLRAVIAAHGRRSVGVYLGNPNAHTIAGALYAPQVVRALKTRQVFSASTLDQMPKHVACGYLFGNPLAFTVPISTAPTTSSIIGANPLVSNGSVATAADFPGKLKALKRRGGRLTVIDPNRTRTAELADRHLAPRPGTDGALLFAVVNVLFDEDLADPDLGGLAEHVTGVEQVRAAAAGIPAGRGRRALRGQRRGDPRAGPRYRRRAPHRGLRPHRHLHRAVRHHHQLAGRRDQCADRQSRPARRGDVRHLPHRLGAATGQTGPRVHRRPLAQPGVRTPGGALRTCPPRCCRRRSRHPATARSARW